MLEIPESTTVGTQADNELTGKTVAKVFQATSPHSFTWYNGDPLDYGKLLEGRSISGVRGHGAYVTIDLDGGVHLAIGDGTNIKYGSPADKHPQKHQMLVEFTDGSFIAFTVSMYGVIYAFEGTLDNFYYAGSLEKTSPLSQKFDRAYFEALFESLNGKDMSAKAFLATEQRIPGLGNGVVQDILFNARINPKRKISTLSGFEKDELFHSLKVTIENMTDLGGRDTEKDFFSHNGGYKTILSKLTYKEPCPVCGDTIVKEAFLGGTIYYCPTCQPVPPKRK